MGHIGLEHSRTANSNMFADDVCIVALHVLHCSTFFIDLMIQRATATTLSLSLLTSNFSVLTILDDLLLVVCCKTQITQLTNTEFSETHLDIEIMYPNMTCQRMLSRYRDVIICKFLHQVWTKQICMSGKMHQIVGPKQQIYNAVSTFG